MELIKLLKELEPALSGQKRAMLAFDKNDGKTEMKISLEGGGRFIVHIDIERAAVPTRPEAAKIDVALPHTARSAEPVKDIPAAARQAGEENELSEKAQMAIYGQVYAPQDGTAKENTVPAPSAGQDAPKNNNAEKTSGEIAEKWARIKMLKSAGDWYGTDKHIKEMLKMNGLSAEQRTFLEKLKGKVEQEIKAQMGDDGMPF